MIVNDNSQDVHYWIERFEHKTDLLIFESSAKLPDDETKRDQAVERLKRMCLLSSVGKDGYKLLKSLSWPDRVRDKSYEDLKRLLQTKLAPPVNTASEQYKFSLCKQQESESLSAFLARIKDKASLCAFGDQFQNMVRNRFICGIRASGIRMQLLSSCEETTTVDRIFELAVMKEQANLDNNVMATVNVVDRQRQNFKPRGNHFNQTNKNYPRSKTKPQYKIICQYCKRPGHFVKDCWKLARKEKSHNVEANLFNSHSEIDTVSYSNNVFSVDQLPICNTNSLFGDRFSSRPLLDINICGKSLKMELDTGSTIVF